MNLAELRDLVSFIVDYNEGQTDQDFRGPSTDTNKHIDRALNLSYKEEVRLAIQNGGEDSFRFLHTFTWAASATSMAIPDALKGKIIEAIRDDTDQTPGPILRLWDQLADGTGLYKRTKDTWGWNPAPSSAKTLTALFHGMPEDMKQEGDVPWILDDSHHELLAWSAAIWLRTVADEQAPSNWLSRQQELRFQLWKEVSRGTPKLFPPKSIRHFYPDMTEQL
jgi:hypothetical protein